MIIHFLGSRSKIDREIDYYRRIVSYIEAQGHTLAYDWLDDTYGAAQEGRLKKRAETWSEIDRRNTEALSHADIVVVEATAKGFFAGYRVALAIVQKKPLLLLTRDKSPLAISGLSTPSGFIKSTTYDDSNLETILEEFLSENVFETKDLRFNFVLDRQTYNYLRWMSSKTGKTKAQIIRNLLQKEMSEDD